MGLTFFVTLNQGILGTIGVLQVLHKPTLYVYCCSVGDRLEYDNT